MPMKGVLGGSSRARRGVDPAASRQAKRPPVSRQRRAAHRAIMGASLDTIGPVKASSYFITAPEAAALVREALSAGKIDLAIRQLTEAVARLVECRGVDIPDDMFEEPATTGDRKYDVVLATAFLYACNLCGVEEAAWMHTKPLDGDEWLWGGDGFESSEYRDLVRRDTPEEFLRAGILTRRRDWINA
jgi:hypothetical protein